MRTTVSKFLERLRKFFGAKEITNRILLTAFIIVVFRLLAAIPLPGVNIEAFRQVLSDSPFSNVFTLISGGRLDSPSLVAIGIAPYINASIVIQLLTTIVPRLEELSKQGEIGRRKINQYTRWLTLPLAVLQSIVIYSIFTNPSVSGSASISSVINNISGFELIVFITTLTTGSMLLMWLGELITEYGIGNGASVIIAFGIIASLPSLVLGQISGLSADWQNFLAGDLRSLLSTNFVLFYSVILIIIIMTIVIIYTSEAVRKLIVVYAKRYRGSAAASSYLPVKLNQAGVMPVIFAQALLTFPLIIASFILSVRDSGRLYDFAQQLQTSRLLQANSLEHIVLLVLLIVIFTYFYTYVVIKPAEIAKNLQKSGAFLPGVRPGNETIKHLGIVTARLTFFGGVFLAVIAVIPSVLVLFEPTQQLTILSGIGGTSLLIVVSVFMDSYRKMIALRSIQNYEIYK